MQTKPINSIFNEWKDWALVVQPLSLTSLSNNWKDNLNSSYLPKKFGFINLDRQLINFILIIDLLYIVQKAKDCFSNCLCQST